MPAQGSRFTSWAGCDSSSGAECTVQVSADRSVVAAFTHIESLSLYDDFNGTSIDLTKWQGEDVAREVTNGQLRMKARSYYNSTQPVHIDLSLPNPDTVQTIEAMVTLGTYQNRNDQTPWWPFPAGSLMMEQGQGFLAATSATSWHSYQLAGRARRHYSPGLLAVSLINNGNLVQTIDMGTFTTAPVLGTPSPISIRLNEAAFLPLLLMARRAPTKSRPFGVSCKCATTESFCPSVEQHGKRDHRRGFL